MRRFVLLALAGALLLALGLWFGTTRSENAQSALDIAASLDDVQPSVPEPSSVVSAEARDATRAPASLPAEPEAAPGVIVLEGRVIQVGAGLAPEHGSPAAGATVTLQSGFFGANDKPDPTATTRADGTFRLELADAGKRPFAINLVVHGDETFRAALVKDRLAEGETRRGGIVLVRYEHGALDGRTVDVEGRPICGVEVVLLDYDDAGENLVAKESTRSDEAGAFRFARVSRLNQLEARKSGYTFLDAVQPRQADDGTWPPLEVVLAVPGALRLEVVDSAGAPVADVRAGVVVAPPERFGTDKRWESLRSNVQAITDASGVARFDDLWARQRLLVGLSRPFGSGTEQLGEFERVRDDAAVLDGGSDGEPLSIEPGTERVVRVALQGYRISGRVVAEDGSPFPEPWLRLRPLDSPASAPAWQHREVRGDEEGRFAFDVLVAHTLGRALLSASDGQPSFIGNPQPAKHSSFAFVDLSVARATEELVLVMRPTGVIAGRVVCEVPEITAEILAYPLSDALPFGGLTNGAGHSTRTTRKTSEFRLAGLPTGRYDLEVTPSQRFPTVWLRDVAAGTEGLTVVLAGTRPARVTVEVVPPSPTELSKTILLTGRLRPHSEWSGAPELARETVLRAPRGWPPSMMSLWSGGGGHTDELGWTRYVLAPMKANPTTLELDEGLYWIGVQAKAENGNLTFPIGTGLVRVGAGEHRLRFELPPSASLEGRITGARPAHELFVALVQGGERLVLDVGRREMAALAELGADGSFRFPKVPAGALELRVGTREELSEGRWLRRQEIELARGEAGVVEVEL